MSDQPKTYLIVWCDGYRRVYDDGPRAQADFTEFQATHRGRRWTARYFPPGTPDKDVFTWEPPDEPESVLSRLLALPVTTAQKETARDLVSTTKADDFWFGVLGDRLEVRWWSGTMNWSVLIDVDGDIRRTERVSAEGP